MSVLPYNPLETFYNDIIHEIVSKEESYFMKYFYTESWKEPDFTPRSLENVIWYLKTPEDKKQILDEDLEHYNNTKLNH